MDASEVSNVFGSLYVSYLYSNGKHILANTPVGKNQVCRYVRHSQFSAKDNEAHISFPLLLGLLSEYEEVFGVSPSRCTGFTISYEDHDGTNVLIGSTEELQYVASLFDFDEMMELNVTCIRESSPVVTKVKQQDDTLDPADTAAKISSLLDEMETRMKSVISKAVQEAETRMMSQFSTFATTQAPTRLDEECEEGVIDDEVAPIRLKEECEEAVIDDEAAILPSTPVDHLVAKENDTIVTKKVSFKTGQDENQKPTAEPKISTDPGSDFGAILQKCVDLTAQAVKTSKGNELELRELRCDISSKMTLLSEWNKTVLDGIKVQTMVLSKNKRSPVDSLMKRMERLEKAISHSCPGIILKANENESDAIPQQGGSDCDNAMNSTTAKKKKTIIDLAFKKRIAPKDTTIKTVKGFSGEQTEQNDMVQSTKKNVGGKTTKDEKSVKTDAAVCEDKVPTKTGKK